MPVHGMRSCQEFPEAGGTDCHRQRQPHSRPDRIPAAHPVPHRKCLPHAERMGRFDPCRDAHEMLAQAIGMAAILCCAEPGHGSGRIGHGFERREGLARHDEEGMCRLHPRQHIVQGIAVDIAHEMETLACVPIGSQRLDRHARPQIGPPDAYVDDIRDGRIVPHPFRIVEKSGAHGIHLAPQRLQGLRHACFHRLAQQPVHDPTPLRMVDALTGKHGLTAGFHSLGTGQPVQKGQHVVVDVRLREIDVCQPSVPVDKSAAQACRTPGIPRKGSSKIEESGSLCRGWQRHTPWLHPVDRKTRCCLLQETPFGLPAGGAGRRTDHRRRRCGLCLTTLGRKYIHERNLEKTN